MLVGGGVGTVVIVVLYLLLGGDPRALMQQAPPGAGPGMQQGEAPAPGINDEARAFVATVLADTEDVWEEQFRAMGKKYRRPKLVLFEGSTDSGCGFAQSAMGPFYCPADETVYIDLEFFDELRTRFRAPGDFAQAYVLAHEIGHHVQNLLGKSEEVQRARARLSEEQYNQLSVRLELQADFYAGVWANHANRARQIIEDGDVEEALAAANAIGDDRLQRESRGYVVPDSFTHGSSAQRVKWFRKGLQSGDIRQGDTFNTRDL